MLISKEHLIDHLKWVFIQGAYWALKNEPLDIASVIAATDGDELSCASMVEDLIMKMDSKHPFIVNKLEGVIYNFESEGRDLLIGTIDNMMEEVNDLIFNKIYNAKEVPFQL
jgi:hypothetical protein